MTPSEHEWQGIVGRRPPWALELVRSTAEQSSTRTRLHSPLARQTSYVAWENAGNGREVCQPFLARSRHLGFRIHTVAFVFYPLVPWPQTTASASVSAISMRASSVFVTDRVGFRCHDFEVWIFIGTPFVC